MNFQTLARLAAESRFDVCHENCRFDAHSLVYVAKGKNRVRLFKALLSSKCRFDCTYCPNPWRKGISVTPEQFARAFLELRRLGLVDGVFVSSGMHSDPEKVMEDIIETGRLIRKEFGGYIHLKVVPGASREQIKQAVEIANRVSINIEVAKPSMLNEVGSVKSRHDVLRRERWISREVRRRRKVSHTTQVIAGLGESDADVISCMKKQYEEYGVTRFYISPFTPVKGTPMESRRRESGRRVARLYNVDALIRLYGFDASRIMDVLEDGMLKGDPKALVAEKFGIERPIDIPGIGLKAAKLMEKGYSLRDLKRMGFSVKKAAPYVAGQTRLCDFSSI
ncbi:radical SAM protein [Archaeoglobus veneficus]|uniref:Radical SAM domain protein n=1 Tax=Archaeoglobus veneficus (strain DSM 11195 / SNP6) TaxID=693661 RepID=F2KMU9_ARCVS|nr:radical SAM protein [Archaeoglobus veneficus]AEA46123.1 Radical SAM domain protein [Archaeoglobus veneficus SNP6]